MPFARLINPAKLLAVFAVALALLWAAAPAEFEVAPDTSRDIGLARNCRTADICLLKGPSTSVPEVYHGGLWIAHLSVLDGLGLGLAGVRFISLMAIALSVALTAALAARLFGSSAGLTAAALCVWFLGSWKGAVNAQWNPTLVPLPAAALFFSTVLAVETRRSLFYVATAFCLALLIQLHPVTLVLLPFVAGAGVIFPPAQKRVATVAAVLIVFAASFASLSWDAVVHALSTLGEAGGNGPVPGPPPPAATPFWPYLLLTAGCSVVFLLVTRYGLRSRAGAGVKVLAGLSVGPLMLLVVLAAATGRHSTTYYLLFLLPAVTLLPAALVDAFWNDLLAARLPRLEAVPSAPGLLLAGSVVLSALLSLPGTGSAPRFFSFGEARVVADKLPEFGVDTFGEATARIRSPNVFHLLSALQVYLHDPEEGETAGPPVMVVRSATAPPGVMPPGWQALAYGENRWLYLAPWPEALDWTRFKVAYGEENFRPATSQLDRTHSEFGYPQQMGLAGARNWKSFTVEVPIRIPGNDALVLEPYVPSLVQGATAEVVAVSGIVVLEDLPAAAATVATGQAGVEGTVKIAWAYPGVYPLPGMVLPFVAEYQLDDDRLPRIIDGVIP